MITLSGFHCSFISVSKFATSLVIFSSKKYILSFFVESFFFFDQFPVDHFTTSKYLSFHFVDGCWKQRRSVFECIWKSSNPIIDFFLPTSINLKEAFSCQENRNKVQCLDKEFYVLLESASSFFFELQTESFNSDSRII